MTWLKRHRLRRYVVQSIWIGPCVGIVVAIVTARLAVALDRALNWRADLDPATAQMVLVTLASSMFTFVVFVSSSLLIALQLASASLTPRIIGLVFRDGVMKWSLTLFVFTFTLTLAVVLRIRVHVPVIAVHLSAYACVASLAVFLYLIDHIGRLLRPANALRMVARHTRGVIQSVYPLRFDQAPVSREAGGGGGGGASVTVRTDASPEPRVIVESAKDGVILACEIGEIVEHARRSDCVLEMVPQVGDFIGRGDPLFRLVRGEWTPALSPASLRRLVAIGHERSLEQDPAFAFRIMVDIACKALSPAINDPTTAVLAIDQIQHLLGIVGRRHLDEGHVVDAAGAVRLLYRTPGWDDFVHLAVVEIRQFGATSIQVTRRLNAMIESLLRVLPPERAPALRDELAMLQRSAVRSFTEPEDQVMAGDSDCQGVGGKGADSGNSSATSGEGDTAAPQRASAGPVSPTT
jgi:uncharacterized membrane protein